MSGCTSVDFIRIGLSLWGLEKGSTEQASWLGGVVSAPGTCLSATLSPESEPTWGWQTQYLSHHSDPALWRTRASFFRLGNQGSERPCNFCGKRLWNGAAQALRSRWIYYPLGQVSCLCSGAAAPLVPFDTFNPLLVAAVGAPLHLTHLSQSQGLKVSWGCTLPLIGPDSHLPGFWYLCCYHSQYGL